MDYLLRDSHMCGVNYGVYDPDRILKSMCAYGRADQKELRIAVRYSGLGALEDLLLARYQMHAQIYGHKTNRACNAMLECIRERLVASGWTWYENCSSVEDLLKIFVNLDDRAFTQKLINPEVDGKAGKVKELAEKLFLERKLIKRVFEEKADCSKDSSPRAKEVRQRYEEHKSHLKEADIWAADDEFKNKGPKVNSDGYPLKMLRKQPQNGFYMVHEIKDFSTVIQFLPELECTFRIYCKDAYVKKAKKLLPT
jgi:HD superfamily phosphohydrolase